MSGISLSRRSRARISLHATLIVLFLLIATPFAWALLNSFKSTLEIFSGGFWPRGFSLDNYVAAWTVGNFGGNFANSVIVSVSVVVVELLVAVPAGYAFAKLWFKRFPWVFYIFIVGMAIPLESFVITLFFQLKDMGLVNTPWGVVWPTAASAIPFAAFVMRNFFRSLPDSLMEAAELDGAGRVRTFLQVMLPLAKPAVLVVAVLGFLDAWNEFLISILVLLRADVRTIPIGMFSFVNEYGTNYGAIFAGTVLSIIPSLIIYILFQRSFTSGLTAGATRE